MKRIVATTSARRPREKMILANESIKVNVMHSDSVVTFGVTAILSQQTDMLLSSFAVAGPDAGDANVIVTDYHGAIRMLEERPACLPALARILIVTTFEKEQNVRYAMKMGVQGYLLQSCVPEELVRAVKALHHGCHFVSDSVAHCVANPMKRGNLTGRESDVLQLLAKGYCNKTIARELGIGVGTVKSHVKGVLGKLNATARTHAVFLAAQRGLLINGAYNG
jgi:DNA-binding NarL/FixJ family response regulator